jgi:SAM-dependent methyltransferase
MRPDPRSAAALRAHFEVERTLADQLRRSTRAERTELFKTLYGELFSRVPDHARLVRRDTPEESSVAVEARLRLIRPHLAGVETMVEFAPGDCRLSWAICDLVPKVVGIDISDQSGAAEPPANFDLILYDGYNVDLADGSADLVFSYQFLEHLHPEDVPLHFELVQRLLKPGGRYIFSTPHRFSGPHDISRFFSNVPQGFHLQEWIFGELATVAKQAGFSSWRSYRMGALRDSVVVNGFTLLAEAALASWPRSIRRRLAGRIFEGVTMAVIK